LKLKSGDELITKGEEFKKAFLTMDAELVSTILSNFFSTISFYQLPEHEKTFHSYVQMGQKDHSTVEELNQYLAEAADEYLT
jgi:hypothetical protein